jgi:hypothetical protein
MADSKFDRLFQNAEPEPPAAAPAKAPRRRAEPQPLPSVRPLGRPPGKRSDPAWKQFSVLLKRDTQREAAAILRSREEGPDLSGLVQNLLENWIKRQKP